VTLHVTEGEYVTTCTIVTRSTAPITAILVAVAVAMVIAACGGSGSSGPAAGSGAKPKHLTTQQLGAEIFADKGCGGCHTLAAANSTGTIGPDLDDLKPSYAAVVHQVTNGGGGMPRFKGQLSAAQISAVAHYVASTTH
jgi:cytochrome c2